MPILASLLRPRVCFAVEAGGVKIAARAVDKGLDVEAWAKRMLVGVSGDALSTYAASRRILDALEREDVDKRPSSVEVGVDATVGQLPT